MIKRFVYVKKVSVFSVGTQLALWLIGISYSSWKFLMNK